jgi:hypothetical protein
MTLAAAQLRNRRFSVRFLGRPWTWLWLLATGIPFAAGWYLVAVPARGSPGDQRSWFLWSGNILLALFVATVLFSARKWSIKLPFFRDFGRASRRQADATFVEIQELNRKIRQGAYVQDDEIMAAAEDILERHGMQKVQRAELRTLKVGAKDVKYVGVSKAEPFGRLEPWLEMHMGIGTIACLAVWLHADFMLWHHVGWALVVLSMIVLLSGLFGALFFRVLPPKMANADPGIPYEEAGVARETYEACLDGIIATLEDPLRGELSALRKSTGTPGSLRRRNDELLGKLAAAHPEDSEMIRDLAVMSGSRDYLAWTSAAALRLDFLMRLWRWVHVPLSVALFFVIALHVWQVIWY